MTSLRKTALVAGVWYLLSFVSIPTLGLYGGLRDPNYVLGPGSGTGVIWGGVLEMIVALAGIGTAVVLYPVVKRQGEARGDEGPSAGRCATGLPGRHGARVGAGRAAEADHQAAGLRRATRLAGLDGQRVHPYERVRAAIQRPVAERHHLRVQAGGHLRHLRARQRRHAQLLDQLLHPPGRHPSRYEVATTDTSLRDSR
jgi:hypothetical protein